METQALQPPSVDPGTANLCGLHAKLEHAGLQMQACLNVIEEQRAHISVFRNAWLIQGQQQSDIQCEGAEACAVLPNAAKTSGWQNT